MANFYSSLNGIPIDFLVASPLMAAARANLALAQNLEEFIFQVGYANGQPGGAANIISFNLTRPFTNPVSGLVETQTISVNCPLLGLVPIPALLVDKVIVNFTTEISTSTSVNTGVNLATNFGFAAFSLGGSLSVSSDHMRSSNQSATYTFEVTAEQQPATEGMGQLMDVMASCIQPIPTGGSHP